MLNTLTLGTALPLLLFLFLLPLASPYIDISLEIATSSSDIAYNLPLSLNSQKLLIAISLENKEEFIVTPSAKHKGKLSKTKGDSNHAELTVSSL